MGETGGFSLDPDRPGVSSSASCAPSEPQFPHLLSGSSRTLWRVREKVPGIISLHPGQGEKRDGQGPGPHFSPVLSRPHPASTPLANICSPHEAASCFLFLPHCKAACGDATPCPFCRSGRPWPPHSLPSWFWRPLGISHPPLRHHLPPVSPPSSSGPPSASSHLPLFPSTAQEVLGLQGHPSQGSDEAAGRWRGPRW